MNQNTWHLDQLKKELENRNGSETDRIDLINPETNKILDQKLWNNFWLPIKRTLEGSRFSVMEATLKDGKPEVCNKWDILPCRTFEIMLDNPSNPPPSRQLLQKLDCQNRSRQQEGSLLHATGILPHFPGRL